MALFFVSGPAKKAAVRGAPSLDLIHQLQCRVCPLDKCSNRNPHMAPTGGRDPMVYVLGEAPGKNEDIAGRQFIGASGEFIRDAIPDHWFKDPDDGRLRTPKIRWNNVVRTRPPKNRTPTWLEIEACRPSVIQDIEESKPNSLVVVGATALHWLLAEQPGEKHSLPGIQPWRGRRFPMKVGEHVVWCYPLVHPSFIIRMKRPESDTKIFKQDVSRIFAESANDSMPPPEVEDLSGVKTGITIYKGEDESEVQKIVNWMRTAREESWTVAIDIETASDEKIKARKLRPYGKGARILTIALTGPHDTIAFPIKHGGLLWTADELARIEKALVRLLLDERVKKIAHNAAFELEWLSFFYGVDVLRANDWHDTQAQAFVLDERTEGLALDAICIMLLGLPLKRISDLDVNRLQDYPIDDVLMYNALDAKYTRRVYWMQRQTIKAERLLRVYRDLIGQISTIVATQRFGVKPDFEAQRAIAQLYDRKAKRVDEEIQSLRDVRRFSGGEFNPGSADDVKRLLKKDLGLKLVNKEGNDSTDEDVLKKLKHPVCPLIIEYRSIHKLRSTYNAGYAEGYDPDNKTPPERKQPDGYYIYPDGLIHPSFNIMITRTGRLSCDSPNMQNWVKRSEQQRRLRRQIAARLGHKLISIDYGQIEARVIAMASHDEFLVKALWDNYDIHGEWAGKLAKKAPSLLEDRAHEKDPFKTLRADVKNQWVFPAFYGARLPGIASYLGVEERILAPLFAEFWDTFKGVRKWQKRLLQFYDDNGYVECLTGRRRHGPMYDNEIINSPIQGTASEIVVSAMDRLSRRAYHENRWLQPMLNIHDDLTFDVPEKRLDWYIEQAVKEMLAVDFDFVNVPISLEVSTGPNWYEMKEIAKYATNDKTRKEAA